MLSVMSHLRFCRATLNMQPYRRTKLQRATVKLQAATLSHKNQTNTASSDSGDDIIANKPNKYGFYISNSAKQKTIIDTMIHNC